MKLMHNGVQTGSACWLRLVGTIFWLGDHVFIPAEEEDMLLFSIPNHVMGSEQYLIEG